MRLIGNSDVENLQKNIDFDDLTVLGSCGKTQQNNQI